MEGRPVILAVDRNRRNLELLRRFLHRLGYQVRSAATLEELDRVLEETAMLALALVSLAGFDRRIWVRCDRLHLADIPFLVIAPQQVARVYQTSLSHGARGMLVKPLMMQELAGTINRLIRE
jgi:DNA-binding response OmpR family regulator